LSLASLAIPAACTASEVLPETWQNEWAILVNYEEKNPDTPGHRPMANSPECCFMSHPSQMTRWT
jgi:hypothetical protein